MESPPIAPVQPAPAIASTDASVTQTSPTNGTLNGVATSAQPSRSLEPIFAKSGMITMASGDITLVPGKDENALTAVGGVTLMYRDLRGHSLQLSAQRVADGFEKMRTATDEMSLAKKTLAAAREQVHRHGQLHEGVTAHPAAGRLLQDWLAEQARVEAAAGIRP